MYNHISYIKKVDLVATQARTSYVCAASICQYIGFSRLFERNEEATGWSRVLSCSYIAGAAAGELVVDWQKAIVTWLSFPSTLLNDIRNLSLSLFFFGPILWHECSPLYRASADQSDWRFISARVTPRWRPWVIVNRDQTVLGTKKTSRCSHHSSLSKTNESSDNLGINNFHN